MLGDREHLIRLKRFVASCAGFILPLMSLAECKLSQQVLAYFKKHFFFRLTVILKLILVFSNRYTRRKLVFFSVLEEINRSLKL